MSPITKILAAAGGNDIVRAALDKAHIVIIDEDIAGPAMKRIPRAGVSFEHTLFGNTKALRKIGAQKFHRPPRPGLFVFGELDREATSKKARSVTLQFGSATTIEYRWSGDAWRRSEQGREFLTETGEPIEIDNFIIEQHVVNYSKTIRDVAGNPSIEIEDVAGKGRALLFRDGRVFKGRWVRATKHKPVFYETAGGDPFVLAEGNTWVALLPGPKGEVKGSFQISKK